MVAQIHVTLPVSPPTDNLALGLCILICNREVIPGVVGRIKEIKFIIVTQQPTAHTTKLIFLETLALCGHRAQDFISSSRHLLRQKTEAHRDYVTCPVKIEPSSLTQV
jgi:hypothetical protein